MEIDRIFQTNPHLVTSLHWYALNTNGENKVIGIRLSALTASCISFQKPKQPVAYDALNRNIDTTSAHSTAQSAH